MGFGVSPEHTSVPRWQGEPPEVDVGGRRHLVISSGAAGRAIASEWARAVRAAGSRLERFHGPASDVWLAGRLAGASVGVRVMIAATQLEVLDVLRTARAAGMVDAELRMHVTDGARLRVHCAHCATDTERKVAIGDTIACAGCGRELLVYHHVSRRRGAYLGYQVDAEQPAPVADAEQPTGVADAEAAA